MKKWALLLIIIVAMLFVIGCSKKSKQENDTVLSAEDLKVNTLLLKKDGSVQSSIVETFDKEYYNKEELQQFVQQEIDAYNTLYGEDAVKISSLQEKDENVILILDFRSLEDFERLNGTLAKSYTMSEAIAADIIPDSMQIVDQDGVAYKQEIEENQNYKVFVIHDELDVIVNGTILYYENGAILNNTTMQSFKDGSSVIVYK